jgi:hypothetical protein
VTGISDAGRSALERAIAKARRTLEDDLAGIAEGRFGIHRRGEIEDETSLRLSSSELLDRREVLAVVRHLRNEGESAEGAVERVIREACFTHLNRLVAIRIAEAIGLLMPSLVDGKASRGFREVLEVAPLLASDQYGGYWSYLRLCADELAADAPVLFDPRNPLLALAPSPSALDELVSLLSDSTLKDAWLASDTLGWAYQFFNTSDERRQMREAGAPRSSRELAVRNQFFTPRYVVDFLVQNSLGRRLLEADPRSGLLESMPLLVDPPARAGKALSLDEVLVLDPACGSGHFLLGAYDLLERAWDRVGVSPAEAAPRILPCLHGIDIDARCAQVASAALVLRARRASRSADLPRPNVITARALPRDTEAWQRVLVDLPVERQRLVAALREALQQAPLLGPLLKVEERLAQEIQQAVPEAVPDQLWYRADALGRAEAEVLAVLQRIADEAASTPEERLLAAESGDAIRFVEAMRRRYDVVLMNPPFGEPVPGTKSYLKASYPASNENLFALFVTRGIELCRAGGYVGAITSRAGMFLTTFERWRKDVMLGHQLVALADLGYGVMEQAMVEAAAYVVGSEPTATNHATFIRLLKESDRADALRDSIARSRTGNDDRVFRVDTSELGRIPGSPIAYWMAASLRRLFTELAPLEKSGAEVRQGLATADDFRFVRTFWEVHSSQIARSRGETLNGGKWVPFAKGGEYSPYWSDIHLVVDYGLDGKALRDFSGSVIRNPQYYFRPGITWPLRTQAGFNPRPLPSGCAFGHKGPVAFARTGSPISLLPWLTSRLFRSLLDSVATFGAYEVGSVQRMPWPGEVIPAEIARELEGLAIAIANRRAAWDGNDETTRRFIAPAVLRFECALTDRIASAAREREADAVSMLEAVNQIDDRLATVLHLDDAGRRYLDSELGPPLATLPRTQLPDDGNLDLTTEAGAGAYLFDACLEGSARRLGRHPSVIAEARSRLGLLASGEPRASADDLLSYLVGISFGRWDVRIGRDMSLALAPPGLFDPVPVVPPGMLVGMDGLPSRQTPSGYPLELPPDKLLVDEPGHQWDIDARVRRAADALLDDADAVLDQLQTILGRSLREHLQRKFFKDHLNRYSKSRRQAPIYWQLVVPSLSWCIWVYAPTLTRETLFAIARQAGRRQATGRETLAALKRDLEAGGRGRSQRELSERIAEEEDLALQLEAFRLEAERVAGLGWEPDLDDGLVLCAAPLTRLFLGWPAAADEWKNLKGGQYPWATVSRWSPSL